MSTQIDRAVRAFTLGGWSPIAVGDDYAAFEIYHRSGASGTSRRNKMKVTGRATVELQGDRLAVKLQNSWTTGGPTRWNFNKVKETIAREGLLK